MKNIQEQLIDQTIKDTEGNLSKVARILGVDYFALKGRETQRMMLNNPDYVSAIGPIPSDIKLLGKRGFRQYVVAVKRRGYDWPKEFDNVIKDARKKFDAGTHEIFQTNHPDGWAVLYLIPRLNPVQPRRFFSSMNGGE